MKISPHAGTIASIFSKWPTGFLRRGYSWIVPEYAKRNPIHFLYRKPVLKTSRSLTKTLTHRNALCIHVLPAHDGTVQKFCIPVHRKWHTTLERALKPWTVSQFESIHLELHTIHKRKASQKDIISRLLCICATVYPTSSLTGTSRYSSQPMRGLCKYTDGLIPQNLSVFLRAIHHMQWSSMICQLLKPMTLQHRS